MRSIAASVCAVVLAAAASIAQADEPPAPDAPAAGAPAAGAPAADAPAAGDPAPGAPTAGEPAPARLMLPPPTAAAPQVELAVNRPLTGAFIVVGAVLWAGSDRVFQDTLAPKGCRIICESDVNGFDRELGAALTWDDDELPQLLSDGAAYVAIPLVALGGLSYAAFAEHRRANWVDDMLVVAESTVITGLVNRATALSFGRTRPRTRNAPIDDPVRDSRQAHESFFSGHTSAAFSVGVSAAQVASLRGYRVAPILWGSAFFFGAMTGYMRLAGADHYPTDVLVGATVATAISIVVPRLHVRKSSTRLEPMALADGGGGVRLRGRW